MQLLPTIRLALSGMTLTLLTVGCHAEPPPLASQEAFLEASQLLVGGEPTQFNTESTEAVQVHPSHPRLMFTADEIALLRSKLASPHYTQEVTFLASKGARSKYGGPSLQAFRWQVFGDAEARDWAKEQLLSGKVEKWGHPFYDNQWLFAWATTYDWLSDSLTQQERQRAWQLVKKRMGDNINGFDKGTFAKPFAPNHNDSWGKERYPYEAAVALAIHGDGVDDDLAEHILQQTITGHDSFLSPYLMLDWLNLMALDSGGSQAAHDDDNVSGYAGMYAFPCMLMHGYWESATGEKLWDRSNFFRYFSLWNTYDNDAPLNSNGQAIMEVITGRYHQSDPQMASLAAWYLRHAEPSEINTNLLLPRLIWGDKRVQPASPESLQLPLAMHLRGADCFVSRSSWDADATVVNVATRTVDFLRYEPTPGVISIYRGGSPILVDTRKGKWRREPERASGVTIGRGVSSMYWKPPYQWRGDVGRPSQPAQVASHPAYHPACMQEVETTDRYHSVRVRYDHLALDPVTPSAYRSVIHFHQPPQFVVVIDHWQAEPGTQTLINWRLAAEPMIQGNTFTWRDAAATVLAEEGGEPQWVGGVGQEFERLDGSWAGDNKDGFKPGYAKSAERREKMGLGNVYLAGSGASRVVTVIAIGATEPPAVARQGNTLAFGDHRLLLKEQATFEVLDSQTPTAPASPQQ